jgi:hypothetical protein
MIEIKNRWDGSTIYSADVESMRAALEKAVKAGANLYGADLTRANLYGADLTRANNFDLDLWLKSVRDDIREIDRCVDRLRNTPKEGT